MKREVFVGAIWECACGSGKMLGVLKRYNPVLGSDIASGTDFLEATSKVDNIVTNPPYKLAKEFAMHALQLAERKVALFLRLNFLESQGRYSFLKSSPLRTVYVFSKRQTLCPSHLTITTGGTIAYAWYVWEHGYTGKPSLDWIND